MTWLRRSTQLALVLLIGFALAPERAAACGATIGCEAAPHLRVSGGVVSMPEVPANGWLYWRPMYDGFDALGPGDVGLRDTRDGSAVPFIARADATLRAYVLEPSAPLTPGVVYEIVGVPGCGESGGSMQRFLATDTAPVPSGAAGTLAVIGAGEYQYQMYSFAYSAPAGLCTTPAAGRYADVEVALDPAFEPWRDTLMVDWRVDGVSSVGSNTSGLLPRPAIGQSLSGEARIRLGIACAAATGYTEYPLYDRGFAPGLHTVEAFALIPGAGAPVALGSAEVTLDCAPLVTRAESTCSVTHGATSRGALVEMLAIGLIALVFRKRRALSRAAT